MAAVAGIQLDPEFVPLTQANQAKIQQWVDQQNPSHGLSIVSIDHSPRQISGIFNFNGVSLRLLFILLMN